MLTWLLGTRLGRALAALGGLIVAVIAAFSLGRRDGRRDAREADLERYQKTRREMDHADVGHGDPADDLEWLRDRSKR
ncbi:hypothetical protein [Paracoccus denitrificans]|jgi:hypothetical protein|uniref:hypothetical protein n=1 Tax=Paracoccus denitrificans TaxID=266 RepID=UPI000319C5FA|nr:hypothetical protein [Paracoccus denitrificans]MBB4627898.1 hypothetical protein [Paracoccus denitrificans]MCU7428570.1 hypothetical protein [Paracoccus denitrificans]QAR26459.1 hypothetical protein EO213_09230 [Paracoccus denitrificans]UPV95395.1 hypothetical protein M0K93_02050 [Paracoccus denitrificans]WQO32544.1 hypothetical protein U0005_09385 [Paracoccus denitrificans]